MGQPLKVMAPKSQTQLQVNPSIQMHNKVNVKAVRQGAQSSGSAGSKPQDFALARVQSASGFIKQKPIKVRAI